MQIQKLEHTGESRLRRPRLAVLFCKDAVVKSFEKEKSADGWLKAK